MQARNSAELSRIVGYEGQLVSKGYRRNLQVVRADQRSIPFKLSSDSSTLHCGGIVKRQ